MQLVINSSLILFWSNMIMMSSIFLLQYDILFITEYQDRIYGHVNTLLTRIIL